VKLEDKNTEGYSSCENAKCPVTDCNFFVYDEANHLNWAKIYPNLKD